MYAIAANMDGRPSNFGDRLRYDPEWPKISDSDETPLSVQETPVEKRPITQRVPAAQLHEDRTPLPSEDESVDLEGKETLSKESEGQDCKDEDPQIQEEKESLTQPQKKRRLQAAADGDMRPVNDQEKRPSVEHLLVLGETQIEGESWNDVEETEISSSTWSEEVGDNC